jgi:hypothetical protein
MLPTFRCATVPAALRKAVDEIRKAYAERFSQASTAWTLRLCSDSALPVGGLHVSTSPDRIITLRYQSLSAACRGIGTLLACPASELARLNHTEQASFSMRGLMFDCSRNAVIRPDALKDILLRVSLMGVNMVMLYTEDTYQVAGEPFFGYLRGAYTQKELKEVDRYAAALGIEMIPCIQTLAHLEQMLQWPPYASYRDTAGILLAEDPTVYEFIRKIIRAASAPFRSKRIHIGMDEAHGLGTGEYKKRHGETNAFDIMNRHLGKVRDICRDLKLKPMIWSDMYFRLGSKTHDYYDLNWSIPRKAVNDIPRDVQLVYWDYYHADPEFYRKMIAFHRKLGSEPVFGGGIWTWSCKWCALPWSFTAIQASMTACKTEGLKEVFMTMWGDNGAEVDFYSALPGIQMFCEHVFTGTVDRKQVARRFEAISQGSPFEDWVRAAGIDSVPGVPDPSQSRVNTSCSLLWQDPALAIMDPHLWRPELKKHYTGVAKDLARANRRSPMARRLNYPLLIARAIAARVDLRQDLSAALKKRDKPRIRRLIREIRVAREALYDLWLFHRSMWMATYKPFGWEVIEHRYGGLLARLDTLSDRLNDYLAGRLEAIPELTTDLQDPWAKLPYAGVSSRHDRVKTPSCIK